MKKLVILVVFLASSTSVACPYLTGKYSCSAENRPSVLIEIKNLSFDRYQLEDPPVLTADGSKQVAEGLGFAIEISATCKSNSLVVVQDTLNASTREFIAKVTKTYSPLSNGNMEVSIKALEDGSTTDTRIDCLRQY